MIKRLSKRKDRKQDTNAARNFKLDIKDRFLMLLVYYHLYITYTLAGFLFDLVQSNICRYSKDRKFSKAMLTYTSKYIQYNKEAANSINEIEKYFPGFLSFIDST